MSYFRPKSGTAIDTERTSPFSSSDVALAIFAGQSNSAGTQLLDVSDYITTPLANVYAISAADESYNQTTLAWQGYASNNCQIGSGAGSHRVTTAYFIAKEWQRRVNSGENLPDLYIIHVAGASQGVHGSTGGRWWPGRDDALTDSFYHLMRHLMSTAIKGMKLQGLTPRVLGVDWNQWESETTTLESARGVSASFNSIIDGFSEALGCAAPFHFWRPRSRLYDESRFQIIKDQVLALVASNPSRFSLIDAGGHPDFVESSVPASTQGIFRPDGVHYLRKVFERAANIYITHWLKDGFRGVPARGRTLQTPTVRQQRNVLLSNVQQDVASGVATGIISLRNPLISSGAGLISSLYPSVPQPVYLVSPFRRLSTYTGNVMECTRSSDSTTLSVQFAAYNSANAAALTTFLANTSGTARFFDQVSGHLQSPVSTDSPIVSIAPTGRIDVAYSYSAMTTPDLNLGTQHTSMFVSTELRLTGAVLAGSNVSHYIGVFPSNAPNGWLSLWVAGSQFTWTGLNDYGAGNILKSIIVRRNGDSAQAFINGVPMGTITVAGSAAKQFALSGMGGFSTSRHIGQIREAMHWNVWLNDGQVKTMADSSTLLFGT